jgi:uncharacterized protein YndB with AHSA1/START domain
MPETARTEIGIGHAEIEIPINAPPELVWRAFVEETGRWWLKDFYASAAAKSFIVEPRLGGHVYEDWGNGAGALWYTVISIDPPRSLELAGHLTPAFGGPAKTYLRLDFVADGRATRLRISDAVFGRVSDASMEQLRAGWEKLFGEGLKAYVEAAAPADPSRAGGGR